MSAVIAVIVAGISWGVYTGTPGYQLPAAIEENPTWENYQAYADFLESEENYQELASVLVEAEKQLTNFRPLNYIERLEKEVGGAFTDHLPSEYQAFFALKEGDTEGYGGLVDKLKSEERFAFLDDVYYWGYSAGISEAANDLLSMLDDHRDSVQMHPQDLLSIGAKEVVKIYEPSPSIDKAEEINRLFATWEEAIKGYGGLHDGFYCEDEPDLRANGRPDSREKLVLLQYHDQHGARIHLHSGKPVHVVDLSEARRYEGFAKEKRLGWVVQNETTASSYYYRTTSDAPPQIRYHLSVISTSDFSHDTFRLDLTDENGDSAPVYFQRIVQNCKVVSPFKAEFAKQLMMAEEKALADSM